VTPEPCEADEKDGALAVRAEQGRVALGGYSLRYADTQRGEPVFVCLHGLADTLEVWDALAAPLAQRGRLVRVDQRGHGESSAPPGPCTREDLARDAIAVLDAIAIDRAIWIAHSVGGIVAMTAALLAPERVAGLVLIGTASRCSERTAAWYERIAHGAETAGGDGLMRAIYGDGTNRRARGDPQAMAHVARMLTTLYSDPLTPQLFAIACPVLLLVGEHDRMGPKASQIIHDALPPGRAELHVLPGCGHWLQLDAPAAVIAALDRWRTAAAADRHGSLWARST
jgi:3-oxoadipate enol-lactonase